MPWFKVDDQFHSHPRVRKLAKRRLEAIGLWVTAGSWCARYAERGLIPAHVVEVLGRGSGSSLAHALVRAGLWRTAPGGYQMCDISDWDRRTYRYVPPPIRAKVFERDGYRCVRCGGVDDLTLDHVIPWSTGGPDTVENLRVLCRSCNCKKGARVE